MLCLALSTSCPGKSAKRVFAQMSRASTPFFVVTKNVDGRDEPGHDETLVSHHSLDTD
jgi:hypothetical protein